MKIDLKILKDYGFEDFNDEDYIKYMSIKQFKKHLIDVMKLSRKQALEDVKKLIEKEFFIKGKDIHPPFQELKVPVLSLDRLNNFIKQINKLGSKDEN